MSSLTGKVAFVTGGSRGIGLASAKALVASGAAVAITGTDQGRIDSAVRSLDGNVLGIRADVRQYADVEAALSQAVSKFGGLDILINNAGSACFARCPRWRSMNGTGLSTQI